MQALFNNFWEIYGANWEILGVSREQLAGVFGALTSSSLF